MPGRFMALIAPSLCLVLLASAAYPEAPRHLEYLTAPDQHTLADVTRSSGWQYQNDHSSLGYSDTTHWLRWQVPQDDSQVFVIRNGWLDDFQLSFVHAGRGLASYRTGGDHPASARPIWHPQFAFPIPDSPRPDTVYVRHSSNAALLYPAEFVTRDELTLQSAQSHALHGMYYGLGLIMLIYNLVIYFSVGDRAYLYFVGYASCLMAYLAASDGLGQLYLWPNLAGVQLVASPALLGLALVCHGEFTIHFLQSKRHLPHLTKALRATQLAAVVNAFFCATLQLPINAFLEPVVVLIFCLLAVTIGVLRALQGDVAARVFLLASGVMAVAACTVSLTLLGWIPETSLGRQAAWLGSGVELTMLSLALVWLLKRREHEQLKLQAESDALARRVRELQAATGLAEEHRALQKAMQQAQKLKTIGQMAGGFAHDFNNILATILGFSELAIDKAKDGDQQKQTRYLEEIHQASERGAKLVRQLLTYSRGVAKEPREINVADVVQDTANLLRGSLPTSVAIRAHLPDQPLSCTLDPAQIQQALVNLALNASDAMDQRGAIDLHLEQVEVDDLKCSSCGTRFNGNFVRIKMEDNGRGFSGNAQELFTPFFTTKPTGHGSGLGLSVVHGIVHEHAGHVHLSNRGRTGARCAMYLPMGYASRTNKVAGKRILLVEDDPSVARYLESLLGENDFAVTSVQLPTQALAQFVERPDDFHLVITDQVVPHGSGIELAEDIHELRPDLPVIMATANPDDVSEDDALRAGILAVFGKPIETDLLLAKVRGLLTSRG